MKTRSPILAILFAALFLIVGIIILLWGVISSRSAFASQRWPSETGTVTLSEISHSTSSKGGTTYGARIHYDYTVNGNRYTGTQVSFGDYSSSDSSHASQVIFTYPVGKSVRVFYDPNDPKTAVLETGFSSGLLIPLGIGAVFTMVGGWLMINLLVAYVRAGAETETAS